MSTPNQPLTLLTLPPEIRNQVYAYIFVPSSTHEPIPPAPDPTSPLAKALQLDSPSRLPHQNDQNDENHRQPSTTHLSLLLVSTLLHHESALLALSTTTFHLHSKAAEPEHFALLTSPLSPSKLSALKHLTLTARISQLRALNETWHGVPFGHPALRLETLTLVPCRPDATNSAWAEVAELDQCHTLAHVLAETFKTLAGVGEVRVVNAGCFGGGVWRLAYKHLVFKVWRWGGENCGVRFECEDADMGVVRVFLGKETDRGVDAGVEAWRLLSAEGTRLGVAVGGIGAP
jgi:hypothetical protein